MVNVGIWGLGFIWDLFEIWDLKIMEKKNLFELIVSHTCKVIPKLKNHTFKPEDRLKDLGANSLDRSEILDMVMESLSLQIPRVKIFGAKNIGELVDILYENGEL